MKRSYLPRFATAVCVVSALVFPGVCALRADPPKLVESPTAATAGKATLAVTESERTQTIEAEGRDVSITGSHNKITVTGKCHALTVNGDGNEVTAASVVSISTPGNHNHVTYKQAADGDAVQVTNVGAGNEVSKRAE
jgi:hypothetical protein